MCILMMIFDDNLEIILLISTLFKTYVMVTHFSKGENLTRLPFQNWLLPFLINMCYFSLEISEL